METARQPGEILEDEQFFCMKISEKGQGELKRGHGKSNWGRGKLEKPPSPIKKQCKTVDNSYKLLYTVCNEGGVT